MTQSPLIHDWNIVRGKRRIFTGSTAESRKTLSTCHLHLRGEASEKYFINITRMDKILEAQPITQGISGC